MAGAVDRWIWIVTDRHEDSLADSLADRILQYSR
jgi:hypothetical protein